MSLHRRQPRRPQRLWDGDALPSPRSPREVVSQARQMAQPVEKFSYVRSEFILRACRELDCQACGRSGETQAAHSNWAVHGKGKGIKASDVYVAALCTSCHRRLDQGSEWSEAVRKFVWFQAHQRTVALLVCLRLWPEWIPAPDTSRSPL